MKQLLSLVLLISIMQVASAQNWLTTGNSGLTSSNFIGTTDNKALIFKTNNKEYGRLQNTGAWRFGTSTNYAQVTSDGKLSFAGPSAGYIFSNDSYIFQYFGSPDIGLFYNSSLGSYEFRNGGLGAVSSIFSDGTGIFTGGVAIGTSSVPAAKLDVFGTIAANDNEIRLRDGGDGNHIIKYDAAIDGVRIAGFNGGVLGGSNPSGDVLRWTWDGSSGKVGIGTTLPAYKLDVNGDVNINSGILRMNGVSCINATGAGNFFAGRDAGKYTTTGYSNVAIGIGALYRNVDRNNTVAVGDSALYKNGLGVLASYQAVNNTAVGSKALFSNTKGYSNTANGFQALYSNTTGYYNTANGSKALYSNTTGYYNTANGNEALYSNTGDFNTANGHFALRANTTGRYNTATGAFSLSNSTGDANTANGTSALESNTTGFSNTANGYVALLFNTTGIWNTAVGSNALYNSTTGSQNTALGYGADVTTGNLFNATAIGSNAISDASNKIRIGNTAVTSIGGQVGWTTFSDGRYKKNIKEDVKGLAFINSLKPITYTVDINGLDTYFDKNRKHDSAYDRMKKDRQPAADQASKMVYNGFIAQDVEAAAKKLNYNFSGVDKPKTEDGLYGLRYSDFVVPLVKAVQELSASNELKDAKIESLEQRIAKLELLMTEQKSESKTSISLSGVSLDQNIPNPFTNTTTINYTLPQSRQGRTVAQIIITDKTGKTIKAINISGSGKGTLQVDASTLASGAYSYALYVDGKLVDTKTMLLTK